jgi:chemotaxis protein histidine kinase CheA/CheY-like chemotaxis protein
MSSRRAAQLAAFRDGVAERISRIGVWWIQAETGVAPPAATAEILRDLHTLKGEAAILGFTGVPELIHALEAAIQRNASGIGDAVLRAVDMIGVMIQGAPGAPPPGEHAALLAQLGEKPAPAAREPVDESRGTGPLAVADAAPATRKAAVRVAAAQLDRMRDAIGDLLSLRIRLAHLAEELRMLRDEDEPGSRDAKLKRSEAQLRDDALILKGLTDALDGTVRELRLVPVGSVLERYPRVVRDLARDLGKAARVELEGESAVIDREVIEPLDQALLHLVRNSVDHGIEAPAIRKEHGKPEHGKIRISAKIAASRLQLVIADDGGGIDLTAVRRVAVERGLVDARAEASDDQALQWIMLPGFTTRATATQVSGRGVGLDAVHATVQALGGSVRVASERGRGTSFHLSVPINTAITSVLMFHVGEARYALPAGSVEAIVDAHQYKLEDGLSGPVIAYRDVDIPVVSLPDLLARRTWSADRRRLVIVRTGFGLIACAGGRDHEHRDAVMRPVGSLLSSQTIATSAIVLENGEIALVLNPARLYGRQQARPERAAPASTTVLVTDDSPIVRDLICEVLRSHGMIVVEAGDGVEALEQLERHPEVALLVTDVEMPRMNGLDLIRRIRAGQGRRLPAVVVSTRGSDEDKRLAASIGADAYLVKSDLTHDSLWTLIERFVSG